MNEKQEREEMKKMKETEEEILLVAPRYIRPRSIYTSDQLSN